MSGPAVDPMGPMAPLHGHWTRARTLQSQDVPYLYELLTHPVVGRRFRMRGQTPSPEEFARRLWDGVLAQWVIELRSPPRPLGLVVVTEPDFINGTAFFSMVADPAARNFGILLDGAAAVIDHAFQTWPFRYLYADVAEESLDQFASGREWLFEEDGRRRKALYLDGRYQDLVLLSISRDRWQAVARPMLRRGRVRPSDNRSGNGSVDPELPPPPA